MSYICGLYWSTICVKAAVSRFHDDDEDAYVRSSCVCFIFVLAGRASDSSSQVSGSPPSVKAELLHPEGSSGPEGEPGNSQKGLQDN